LQSFVRTSTFSISTFSISTFSIPTFLISTFSISTFSISTFPPSLNEMASLSFPIYLYCQSCRYKSVIFLPHIFDLHCQTEIWKTAFELPSFAHFFTLPYIECFNQFFIQINCFQSHYFFAVLEPISSIQKSLFSLRET
jgi:hypothetical protein